MVLFLLVLFIFSCTNDRTIRQLDEISSYVTECPQEALSQLNRLKDSGVCNSRQANAYLSILTIQAKDLSYIDITGDSLNIIGLIDYFKGNGDDGKLSLSYYYAGRILTESGDALSAVKYFQSALSVATDKMVLTVKIYSQLGYLYAMQDLYYDAFCMNKRAAQIAFEINDTLGQVLALRDMGSNCHNLNRQLTYLKKAYSLAIKFHKANLICETSSYLATTYNMLGNYSEALRYLAISESYVAPSDTCAQYSIKADIFSHINQDSARFYYKYLALYGSLYNKEPAYRFLTEDALSHGDISKGLILFKRYKKCVDSVRGQTNSEMLAKVKGLYDYHQKEIETSKALEAKRKTIVWASFLVILFIVLLGFSCVLIMHLKRKNREVKRKNLLLSRILDNTVEHKNRQIEVNKERIAALEHLLANAQKEQSMKKDKIVAERNSLLRTNVVNEAEVEEYRTAFDNLKQTAIVKKIFKMVKADKVEHLTVRDKDELEAAFELYLPHFKEKLYAIYVINNRELWVCMLIKLGIAPIDIAVLLACTKSAVSKIRKRLYGKFFGQDGKPEGWDAFIHSL